MFYDTHVKESKKSSKVILNSKIIFFNSNLYLSIFFKRIINNFERIYYHNYTIFCVYYSKAITTGNLNS